MNVVDVGTPPYDVEDWETTVVRFHGFANLPTTRDEDVVSPLFLCLGYQWVLKLYPGGDEDSTEGYVAVELCNQSNTSIKIQHGYSVRDDEGKEMVYHEPDTDKFAALSSEEGNSWTINDFAKRTKLMKSRVNGSLVIELQMKMSADSSTTQFIPTNPLCKNVFQLFNDEASADVLFEVNSETGQSDEHANKKSKTTQLFMPIDSF